MKTHPLYATFTEKETDKKQPTEPKKPKYHKFVKKSTRKKAKSGLSKSVNKLENLRVETKFKSPPVDPKSPKKSKELRISRQTPQTPKSSSKIKLNQKPQETLIPDPIPRKSKSTKTGRKSVTKRRKISKIGGLFVKEFWPLVELGKVLQNWKLLVHVRERLAQAGDLATIVNTYFLRLFEKKASYLESVFSDFNNINAEVREMMLLEFWAYSVLFYFLHEEGEIESLSQGPLETVFTVLLRSVFYIGLILTKAKRARLLDIKTPLLRRFNQQMKQFEFPSGVPLIRTLREGNKTIRQKLKKVLFYATRRIRRQYQWTLDNLHMRFEKLVEESATSLSGEFKKRAKVAFWFANPEELLGPDSGKLGKFSFVSDVKNDEFDLDLQRPFTDNLEAPIYVILRRKITANEFIVCALDPTRNRDSKLKNPPQAPKPEKEEETQPKKPQKKSPKKPKISAKSKKTKERPKSELTNPNNVSKRLSKLTISTKEKERESSPKAKALKMSSFKIKDKKERESGMQKSLVSIQTKTDLSEFSSKYQPLLNVSELRQSALSISRKNKAKSKKSQRQKSDQVSKGQFKITRFK